MAFSKQEYWSGLPFPSPGYLPNPGVELWVSLIAVRRFTIGTTREALRDLFIPGARDQHKTKYLEVASVVQGQADFC